MGLRRQAVAWARMCCERNSLALFGRPAGSRARILCYHSVGTPEWGVNDVSPHRFRRQVEFALRSGYRFVAAEQIATGLGQANDLAVTFDDGLRSVVTNAAPVLAEYGIPWTLFVVSDWADGRHDFGDELMLGWDEVRRVAATGATIGSHSATHPNFGRLGLDQMRHELDHSQRTIASRTGVVPKQFAIPFGQSMNWSPDATRLAREAGYDMIFAQSERGRPSGTIARTFITRFDHQRIFSAALSGAFDAWEEWL
jgi:peptidoglycan/xylan/chitin deacetylase (PgdA/CDA1 family)